MKIFFPSAFLPLAFLLSLTGCGPRGPETPMERAERLDMADGVLRGSSPRDMNQLPKAVPEFRRVFNSQPRRGAVIECDED